jgi:hypothetical protein
MRASGGLALTAALLAGCGFGLHETAKTQRPGSVSLLTGASYISNDTLAAQQNRALLQLGAEVGPLRVGLSEHADIGLGFFYGLGARLDAKFNVLDRSDRLAIAPRLGAGYAEGSDQRKTAVVMGGVIGSYDVLPKLTPYLGLTFANHWIAGPQPFTTLKPGERLAPRTGVGDGLLELAVGAQWHLGAVVALSAEYGLWLPMQDDPGDFYSFVTSQIGSVGVRFCFSRQCD